MINEKIKKRMTFDPEDFEMLTEEMKAQMPKTYFEDLDVGDVVFVHPHDMYYSINGRSKGKTVVKKKLSYGFEVASGYFYEWAFLVKKNSEQ